MKKKILGLVLAIACAICVIFGFAACGNDESKKDENILSVYNSYVSCAKENGTTPLSYEEWLETIKGKDGANGQDGTDGKSAYQIWLENGHTGTEADFLNWLKGKDGINGVDGANGTNGKDGVNGQDGVDGKSAYQIWLEKGHTGTEADFLNWLKGKDGNAPEITIGENGHWFIDGVDTGKVAEIKDENPQGLEFCIMDDGNYAVAVGTARELSTIVIPATYKEKTVSKICDYGFQNCTSLKNISIPDTITIIGSNAFDNCPIETAKIPAIACSYIKNSKLKTVEIISGESIEKGAFYNVCTSLATVIISNTVTSIGDSAFNGCKSLITITIPNSVTSIGGLAFHDCSSLESISLPKGIKSIENGTFWNCTSLESITIPDSVTNIGNNAFQGCSKLRTINYTGNMEQWNSISIDTGWTSSKNYTIICTDGTITK